MPTKVNWQKGMFSKKGPTKKITKTVVKGIKRFLKGSSKRNRR